MKALTFLAKKMEGGGALLSEFSESGGKCPLCLAPQFCHPCIVSEVLAVPIISHVYVPSQR